MNSSNKKVVIIDYQLGNLFSVKQACDTVGINSKISSKIEDILNAKALILPGVGAFNEAMANLNDLGLTHAIKTKVSQGNPLFGICLGLQLLFTKSEEFGEAKGIDIVPGVIKKFPENNNGKKLKVPHIAWNKIFNSNYEWEKSPLTQQKNNEFMYFIHSYYVKPFNQSCVLTKTNYDGVEFCSSIIKDNIFATQFHPEKSGKNGIKIYKNWAHINNLL